MDLTPYIEHTRLSPTLTIRDIDQCVDEAKRYHFFGICVPPFWVKRARREIGSSPVSLATVAGFPLGHSMTETKLDEIKRALDNGADEIDVVWNSTSFKTGIPWTKIEIAKCSRLTHDYQKILKVIIETAYLSKIEIQEGCKLCADAGTDFVKTSSGFAPSCAGPEEIKIMRTVLPSNTGIHAYAEFQNSGQAIELIGAGANRIGTSSAVKIFESILQPLIHE